VRRFAFFGGISDLDTISSRWEEWAAYFDALAAAAFGTDMAHTTDEML